MPKELTHWWLADQAIKQLPDCNVRVLLQKYHSAYLVGAVIPDTLLHLISGPWSSIALKLGHDFHEPESGSYVPLASFAENRVCNYDSAVFACLLGISSHMEADIVFHPFICAMSGQDIGLHYGYETELDLWLLNTGKTPPVWHLEELLTESVAKAALVTASGVFDPDGMLPAGVMERALNLHSRIQSMYGSPFWQLLASGLALLPFTFLRNLHKLFYPFDWKHGRSPDWPSRWKDPATGIDRDDTPCQLADEAVNRIVNLFLKIESEGVVSALKKHPGENLVTGIAPRKPSG